MEQIPEIIALSERLATNSVEEGALKMAITTYKAARLTGRLVEFTNCLMVFNTQELERIQDIKTIDAEFIGEE